MERIPAMEKEKIELEEERKKRLEIKAAKEDLWKLRKKESYTRGYNKKDQRTG